MLLYCSLLITKTKRPAPFKYCGRRNNDWFGESLAAHFMREHDRNNGEVEGEMNEVELGNDCAKALRRLLWVM
uniref:Uncharacterized protein n=1 Tax=Meloidogyne enterolobii TaxID=390850 RepID=A0A6V7XIQ8_MELEN|nr:unnamed protein product [Meloidogyne enterolobii]